MILFAIKSCNRDTFNGISQAVRDTWGKDVKKANADLQFFVGRSCRPNMPQDVTVLPCNDDYDSLPFKTQEMCRWIIRNTDYVGAFLCDNDTYVAPTLLRQRMKDAGAEDADYYGRIWDKYEVGLTFKDY